MKFGFISHPTDETEFELLKTLDTIRSFPLWSPYRKIDSESNEHNRNDIFTFSQVTSLNKNVCDGKTRYLPLLPGEIISNQSESLGKVIDASNELIDWGAEIIGLGGYLAIIGSRGTDIQKRLSVPVTTGNSYTVFTSIEVLEHICALLRINLKEEKVVLIGFPGSIGLALAKMLVRRGVRDLVLVGRRNKKYLEKLIPMLYAPAGVNIDIYDSVEKSLTVGNIILSATSTGQLIHQSRLLPGTIVIDIAYPRDVIRTEPERSDLLIVDGGRFNIHKDVSSDGFLGKLLKNNFYSCLGEVILLALENRRESFSIGRELDIDKIEEIGRLSHKHGFSADILYSLGRPVKECVLTNMKKLYFKRSDSKLRRLMGFKEALDFSKEELYDRYGAYVNPILSEMSKLGNFDRSLVRASGICLWDKDGKQYYDFVGGYGSVNIGHNHPRILQTIRQFLDCSVPSMIQTSPGVMTATLAENLAMITPENLEISFFCNSGTEANEGALKLARIYTGRSKLVYTDNSFHGKTFGSLSVTGREKYQKPFEPLLPACLSVPYGEIEPLDELLRNGDIAAFIVEPIQGEGGVIVPPRGYLKKSEELCKKHKTLMILDEVQTGFGRTGKMFAAEHENIQPDIITMAKSLGGGLLPIGAYITTREIWEKAYGSYDRFLLHTSTFGGNNFSAAAAMTAIQVIYEENLLENAVRIGEYFLDRLKELARKHEFISDVRGKGLMIGIEFNQSLDKGWDKMKDEILGMMPNSISSILRLIPVNLRQTIENTIHEIDEQLKKTLTENFCRHISSRMLNRYNILTLVTLNNPNVMRVQPPLSVTREQVDYFIISLDKVCQSFEL